MSVAPIQAFIDPSEKFAKAGCTEEVLINAVREGEHAREQSTPFDPKIMGAYVAWARTVGNLRERLSAAGWTIGDDGNFPIVISPDGLFAIAVATGDEGTGNSVLQPKTKYRRGPMAKRYVDINQNLLFPDYQAEFTAEESRETWFLLKRRVDATVSFELSLPSEMSLNTPIGNWSHRIFYSPVELDSTMSFIDDDDPDGDIDIPITRKL